MSVAKATTQRPPLPPFIRETAIEKVRLAEDAWNSRDPEKWPWLTQLISRWRNRSEFVNGRQETVAFLRHKMSEGIGLSADQRTVGVRGKLYRRTLRI
jgi:nuclear transport factor 2 (NTF2) superfamily protein